MKTTMKSEYIYNQKGGEKSMKYTKIILAFGVMVSFIGTTLTVWASEDVRNSKHNLSSFSAGYGEGPDLVKSNTQEVCIFCHTPHGGDTTASGSAPLWNRSLANPTSFTPYDSPNFDRGGVDPGRPKGVSLACLSCHDGTLALNTLINYPGSGSTPNITMDPSARVSSTGHMTNIGSLTFPMLGIDLTNDHPIGMEICDSTKADHDLQFAEVCDNSTVPTTGNTGLLPLTRTGATGLPGDIRDYIRAYKSAGSAGGWYIECASCHNPHEGTATRFLRYPSASALEKAAVSLGDPGTETDRNKGSLLCLSCHQK